VLSIKLIYLALLISHFILPVESAELPNVARVSKSLETPGLYREILLSFFMQSWYNSSSHNSLRSLVQNDDLFYVFMALVNDSISR
jgi:hypothetical protein